MLMRWLARLVTPPKGVVLDLFCGTGTTLQAARAEGFRSIGIDSIVCDPPYGLEFMGKEWDSFEKKERRVKGTGGAQAPFANHAVKLDAGRGSRFQEWCETWAAECLKEPETQTLVIDVSWLPVVDWEDLYRVSDRGEVWSLDRVVSQVIRGRLVRSWVIPGKVRRLRLESSGYLRVGLSRPGQSPQQFFVSRLVLTAFDRPPLPGEETLHGMMGKTVNWWPENIRWGTKHENHMDQWRDGTMLVGSQCGRAKMTDELALAARARYAVGGVTEQAVADEFGLGKSAMHDLLVGKTWRHV